MLVRPTDALGKVADLQLLGGVVHQPNIQANIYDNIQANIYAGVDVDLDAGMNVGLNV